MCVNLKQILKGKRSALVVILLHRKPEGIQGHTMQEVYLEHALCVSLRAWGLQPSMTFKTMFVGFLGLWGCVMMQGYEI